MKLFQLPLLFFLLLLVAGCKDDDVLPALGDAPLPSELALDFTVTPDNSGTVSIRPQGQGVTSFTLNFGNGASEPVTVAPGESVSAVYDEGMYTLVLEAMNINGEVTTLTQELTLSFDAPENLSVSVVQTPGNPLSIDVTASADLETNFLVTFGENADSAAVSFQEGETVSYAYSSVGTYEVIVQALSGGAAVVSDTTVVDISNPLLLPIDFEDTNREYAFGVFGGASFEVIDNPDASGLNTSARVAKFNKAAGAQDFAGTVVELGTPLDFSTVQQIRMLVWSPDADIPVLLKLENGPNADLFTEVTANTTVAGQWEELVFDYGDADLSIEYSRLAVFFDFGAVGLGKDYYFDAIGIRAGGPELALPLTFESSELTYDWIGFGGATPAVIDNPDASGINLSSRVISVNKASGSETFAGSVLELPGDIDFSITQQLVVKVWSPRAGIPVLLKLENGADANVFLEVTANTTVASQWEELTFDYSAGNLTPGFSKIAIFFDFGTIGMGEDFYFDDIGYAGEEVPLALPLSFEGAIESYVFTGFGGGSVEIIANPDQRGINTSGQVARLNKLSGSQDFAGAFIELPQPIDFAGKTTMKLKVWSPVANIPVLFKLENATDGAISTQMTVNTTAASEWQELTVDLSGGDLTREYSKVVIFFDFGAVGTGLDYYFDDIRFGE